MIHACGNCEWEGEETEAAPARDLITRFEPGDTYSELECPECGALVFPKDDEPAAFTAMGAIAAIIARIAGEFDHPALALFGPLSTDTTADILAIANKARGEGLAGLSVHEMTGELARRGLPVCVFVPEDVFGDGDAPLTEDQRSKALAALAENRKQIEEAMTGAGFDAIGTLIPEANSGDGSPTPEAQAAQLRSWGVPRR